LKKQGTVVWINCSTDCLYQRLLKEKDQRPLISLIPESQLKDYIIRKYSSRKIFYQQANVIMPEENITLENMLSKIFHANA
jgi:shikimate kinase